MENNTENRSKFLNQYHRQYLNSSRGKCCLRDADFIDELEWIELKSLKNITDKDAIKIYDIQFDDSKNRNNNPESLKIEYGKIWAKGFEDYNFGQLNGISNKVIGIIDFLRSEQYALPWMDLRIDDQIKFGWIKLKK